MINNYICLGLSTMDKRGISVTTGELFDKATDMLEDEKTDLNDFVGITGLLMRLVQGDSQLRHHGAVKRDLVIGVFQLLASKSGLFTERQIELMEVFIVDVLPGLIDAIKAMARLVAEAIEDVTGQKVSICCFGTKK